jgi:hypothetical protein
MKGNPRCFVRFSKLVCVCSVQWSQDLLTLALFADGSDPRGARGSYGKMPKELFEKSYKNLVDDKGENLRPRGYSHTGFPVEGTERSKTVRAQRALQTWNFGSLSTGQVLQLTDYNDLSKELHGREDDVSYVIHTSGYYPVHVSMFCAKITYLEPRGCDGNSPLCARKHLATTHTQVYNSRRQDGTVLLYQGHDDAILNVNGKILITHEVLEHFLDLSFNGRLSFSGYWKAMVKVSLRPLCPSILVSACVLVFGFWADSPDRLIS